MPAGDADTIARIAAWSSQLRATDSLVGLMQAACETAVSISGFEGAWAVRLQDDGTGFVKAASVSGGAPDTSGSVASADHLPPGDLIVDGRPAPVYIGDVRAADAVRDIRASGEGAHERFVEYAQFLASIGVRATFSIPVVTHARTWARLIGHHPARVDLAPAARTELALLAAGVGDKLRELLDEEGSEHRMTSAVAIADIVRAALARGSRSQGLVSESKVLLELGAAPTAILRLDHETRVIGDPLPDGVAEAVLRDARARFAGHDRPVISTTSLGTLADDERVGYLAMRVDDVASELVIWTRPARPTSVQWVEIDESADDADGANRVIGEVVSSVGREVASASRAWTPLLVEAVERLRSELASIVLTPGPAGSPRVRRSSARTRSSMPSPTRSRTRSARPSARWRSSSSS